MSNSVRFPIRAKLLIVISGLVLAGTGAYLALAVRLFREDKTQVVYELNAGTVKTLAAQAEASLLKVADKMRLLTQGHRDEAWTRGVFEAEPDLIAFTLYAPPGEGEPQDHWRAVSTVRNSAYLKLYGLPASEADRIREQVPVPFAEVLAKRTWAANATIAGGAPVMTIAMALEVDDSGGVAAGTGTGADTGASTGTGTAVSAPDQPVPESGTAPPGDPQISERIAVADIRLDKLLKLLSGRGIATAYLVDGEGVVVAHPDAALVSRRASMGDVPIVRAAVDSQLATELRAFDYAGERWLGGYSSVGFGGLRVISQVPEAEAFRASDRLVRKSLLFALIVITLGLLVSRWFARGLTEPLERLLEATERLASGDFAGTTIHVRTRDEVARLARAFNAMASNLRAQHDQLEGARRELEIKVRERTEALEAEKKRQAEAQDALLRTTRLASLGELAGSAAHEVLNPINNIGIRLERLRGQAGSAEAADAKLLGEIVSAWRESYAKGGWAALEGELRKPAQEAGKALLDEDLGNLAAIAADLRKRLDERKEDFDFVGREITRVTRIVNNMRSLSRVGGERRPMDVHAAIDDTATALGDVFAKRKVSLVKDYSAEARSLFTVVADKDELVQVFSNLFRNALHAVEAAKRRAPVIRVATQRRGDRVEVRVIDNGTGIRAEHLPRIFEPDFTTKSVEEGTGLGLSISRRLVRAFGGDIEVEQVAEGESTTFLIWFPAAPNSIPS
jgi:signal transduction histidine kinase